MTTIDPSYFGPDKSLFGIFHPAEGPRRDHGVIVAAPLMNENMRSHFALRLIALNLAEAGFDVLRFDFFGTGSSKGQVQSASISEWSNNLNEAVEKLEECSGASKISVIAVRFAAHLAAALTHQRPIRTLVLWDPVLDGKDWCDSLERGQQDFASLFPGKVRIDAHEVMGYVTNAEFDRDLRSRTAAEIRADESFAVITDDYRHEAELEKLVGSVSRVAYDCSWEKMEAPILHKHEIIDSVCQALS